VPIHLIREGNVRRIYLRREVDSPCPVRVRINVWLLVGRPITWVVDDKRLACLATQLSNSVPRQEVIDLLRDVLSVGRRAYLNGLLNGNL